MATKIQRCRVKKRLSSEIDDLSSQTSMLLCQEREERLRWMTCLAQPNFSVVELKSNRASEIDDLSSLTSVLLSQKVDEHLRRMNCLVQSASVLQS